VLNRVFLIAVLTACGSYLLLLGSSGCPDTPTCNALGLVLAVAFFASAGVALTVGAALAGRLAWRVLSGQRRHSSRSPERPNELGKDP
jgi:hypothetical protein